MKNDKTPQTGASPGAQARCQATPRNRILMVDDDVAFRQLSVGVLVRSGYQVDTAEDGVAAWTTLHANGYDLLITDNDIPKISGVELVKEMRCARITLPVILTSVGLPADELKKNPWLQPVATLAKPFTGGQLLETVNQVLAQSTLIQSSWLDRNSMGDSVSVTEGNEVAYPQPALAVSGLETTSYRGNAVERIPA